MTIREKTEFDNSSAKGTGGLTGSVKVSLQNNPNEFYQLKPSIVDNTLRRRIKAGGTDRENFGEVIAASINRYLFGDKAAPEVSFVYDNDEGKTLIASKYLSGAIVKTLDDYGKTRPDVSTTKKHIKLVKGDGTSDEKIGVDHPSISPLKQGIADAIAQSAFVGDHDVNPGNIMVVINHDGEPQVTRIDFGHALNDLLNAPKKFGGRVRDKENPMMDFLNRKSVAGLYPPGDPSKLWRDYPGIVFSKEMVNAYRKIGNITLDQLKDAITEAKHKYMDLISTLQDDNNEAGITHVHQSLEAIYLNMTGTSLPAGAKVLDEVFTELERFLKKNRSNALDVANTLELQLLIDEKLNSPIGFSPEDMQSIKKIFREKTGRTPRNAIQWVRSDPESLALHDNLDDYILKRAKQLNVIIKHEAVNPTTAYRERLRVNKFIDDANHKRAALLNELKIALTTDDDQKINQFIEKTDINYVKLTTLHQTLHKAIHQLEKYRVSLPISTENIDQMNDIRKALSSLTHLKEDLSLLLTNMDESGDYSPAKALSIKTAEELKLIIHHKILDKPNLVQLHGFFEKLLNVIVTTFTLGYKNYTSSAMKALEELESYASDRPTKPGGLSG
jgi:hypothetical protein